MRPLIIKVDEHKVESNSKVIGSIDLNLITSKVDNSTSEGEIFPDDDDIKNSERLTSSSLVRNLINRYEDPEKATLLKFKSKSMIDLQKPKLQLAPTTQDDHLYNRRQYDKEETFDFKKVLTMFQSIDKSAPVSNYSSNKSKVFNYKNKEETHLSDNFDVSTIKQKASVLLHNKPNLESLNNDSYWQKQVIELLEQISGVRPSNYKKTLNYRKFNYKEPKRQLSDEFFNTNFGEDSGIDETDSKLREVEEKPTASSSVKDIKKYFESNSAEKYIPYKELTRQETEEVDYSSSDSTDSFNTVQTASPTNFSNRMLEEDGQIHAFDLDNLKSLVDDLIREIRYYEVLINQITSDDTPEFIEANDALYNILLKLENIRAYGDEELLNKRKDAIQFVQTCTAQLKNKIKK